MNSPSSARIVRGLRAMALLAVLPLALVPRGAQAQRQRVDVHGVVVDSASGAPVAGAQVSAGEGAVVLADAQGRFTLARLRPGAHPITASALGYDGEVVVLEVRPGMEPLRVVLAANPVELAEIRVQVDRLESRRRAAPVAVRVLRQADLAGAAGYDTRDYVLERSMLSLVPCPGGRGMSISRPYAGRSCVMVRGSATQPLVYIDERPSTLGLDELDAYDPAQLYMVEVYGEGRQVRIYTHWFMQMAAHGHMNPAPVGS